MNAVVDSHRLQTGGSLSSNAVLASHNISAPGGTPDTPSNTVLASHGARTIPIDPTYGHWVGMLMSQTKGEPTTATETQVQKASGNIVGATVRWYWSDIETSAGVYDTTEIETYLDAMDALGKKLIVFLMDRSWNNGEHPVPLAYRSGGVMYEHEFETNHFMFARWHTIGKIGRAHV